MEKKGIIIDPTAFVHPTAILEGNVTIGAYSEVGAGCILTGNITIGHHTWLLCSIVLRGTIVIGNYVNIYDLVNIEGGRPKGYHDSDDHSVIGDYGWVNHGATMHGSQLGQRAAVGINAALDYNTILGDGAILANGSATTVNTIIPANAIAQGVPAQVVKEHITDDDRIQLMGLVSSEWVKVEAESITKWVEAQLKAMGRI